MAKLIETITSGSWNGTEFEDSGFEVEEVQEWDITEELVNYFGSTDHEDVWSGCAVADVTTFQEAGLLTSNSGVVVTLDNGQRIHLTVQVF